MAQRRGDARNSRAWRKLRDQVVDEEPVCRLAFEGICTGASTTADHVIPVSDRQDLALERSNLRGACTECNEARRSLPDHLLVLGGAARPRALDLFRPLP